MRVGVCSFLTVALLLPAQEPAIRISTRLVEVEVIVRNKQGAVEGLTKDDFTLFDKGVEQKLSFFRVVSSRNASPDLPPPLPADVFSNRLPRRAESPTSATVVLIDRLNTHWNDQTHAKREIVRFLRSVQPRDRIGLYVLSGDVKVLQEFTDDSQRLVDAMERYQPGPSRELASTEAPPADTGVVINKSSKGGLPQADVNMDIWLDVMTGRIQDFDAATRARTTLAAIEGIANHLARVPGRKNLIWVSGSFPFSLGIDDFSDRVAVSVTGASPSVNGMGRLHQSFAGEVTRTARAVSNANVAIYPVDARSLDSQTTGTIASASQRATNVAASRIPPGSDSLYALAEQTGGRVVTSSNDIHGAIRKAVEDSEVVYTLAFSPDSSTLDGKFHELKVKVARKGVDVRFRRGYLAIPDEAADESKGRALLKDALWSPLDATSVGLMAKISPTKSGRSGSYDVQMILNTADLSLEKRNDQWRGAVEIVVMQQASDGKNLDSTDQGFRLAMNDGTYQKARREGLILNINVAPKPGMSQIRVAILDQLTGLIGSLRIPAPE